MCVGGTEHGLSAFVEHVCTARVLLLAFSDRRRRERPARGNVFRGHSHPQAGTSGCRIWHGVTPGGHSTRVQSSVYV